MSRKHKKPEEVTAPTEVLSQDAAAEAHASAETPVELPVVDDIDVDAFLDSAQAIDPGEEGEDHGMPTAEQLAAVALDPGVSDDAPAEPPPGGQPEASGSQAEAPTETAAPEAPEIPSSYDPVCRAQNRHRAMCDCTGAAREPIAA